ncbi:unnamed protein product [Schistosoma mattheei]|uniref:Uncharacterized protein n=1 Tax=Schistosoma mattheei TaxID=31246 RepID=A0A183PH41_9TREM|nr:unnamed protein product [Schistosoma mattheei]
MKQLYDTTKKLEGKYCKPERPVKNKEGKPVTEIQEQRNGRVDYFEELLNRQDPLSPSDIKSAQAKRPTDVTLPTTEETKHLKVWIQPHYGTSFDTLVLVAEKIVTIIANP